MKQQPSNDECEVLTSDFESTIQGIECSKRPPSYEESELRILHLPFFQWNAFFLFLGCFFGIIAQWVLTSEIFTIPQDISLCHKEFVMAKESYFNNRAYWDAKQQHFVTVLHNKLNGNDSKEALEELKTLSPEILFSFLLQVLKIKPERFEQITVCPRQINSTTRIMMSKYEKGIWPFKIMLSMELEIKMYHNHFIIEFKRLRRGSRDISLGLCWTYFGPELEPLKALELFALPNSISIPYQTSPTRST